MTADKRGRPGPPGLGQTVALKGEGFTAHVSQGDDVHRGPRSSSPTTSRRSRPRGSTHCPRCVPWTKRVPENVIRPKSGLPWARTSIPVQAFSPQQVDGIVILQDAKEIGVVAADAIGGLLDRNPAARSSPGHRIVADRDLRRTGGHAAMPGLVSIPAGPWFHPRRVRRPCRPTIRTRYPERHRHRVRVPGRLRSRRGPGPRWPRRRHPHACAAYENAKSASGAASICRSSGSQPTDTSRSQRAGFVAGLPDPYQDADRQTRIDNSRFFGGDVESVPTHCLTQGLGDHMEARHVILVATGPVARPKRFITWSKAR